MTAAALAILLATALHATALHLGPGIEPIPLVPVPAGEFLMGSPDYEAGRKADEGPRTRVRITRPFLMGESSVTVAHFAAFAEASGYETVAEREGWSHGYTDEGIVEVPGQSWRDPGFAQDGGHPVVCIHLEDIDAFLLWASGQSGRVVRLPTEAEWEHACRAGTETAFWWGDDPEGGHGLANFAGFPRADGGQGTTPSSHGAPNPWGLRDMHGNTWDIVADWHAGPHPGGVLVDPAGPPEGDHRVRRGGSFLNEPSTGRSANRGRSREDFRVSNRGFRIVVEIDDTHHEGTTP